MDLGSFIKDRIPGIIRGVTGMVAARVGQLPVQEDSTPRFMEKRLAILSKYQEDLKDLQTPLEATFPAPAAVAECPYCDLEETAGVIRNHLLFVAQECKEDGLAPATGGMIPKTRELVEQFIQKTEHLDAPAPIKLVAQLAVMKGQELLPRLEWIHNCEEAREAASVADEMWHRTAKATQMFYADTPNAPYA